ncbi:hypothetical protein, partial [Klebsiella pneumoniae]|uniref:hypothetical protein n=1 Tax=Klebsiella pneumoniae TaxID=573 RepID=UPI001BB1EF7E
PLRYRFGSDQVVAGARQCGGAAVRRSPAPRAERLRTAVLLPRWAARNAKVLAREAAAVALGRARTPRTGAAGAASSNRKVAHREA